MSPSNEDKCQHWCHLHQSEHFKLLIGTPDFDTLDWSGVYPVVDLNGDLTGEVAVQSDTNWPWVTVSLADDGTPILDEIAVDAVVPEQYRGLLS